MTGALVRFAGWLLLAYFAAKIITAYYLFLFAASRVTSALAALPALSPWDAVILLLAAGSLGGSAWGSRITAWAKGRYGSLVVPASSNGVAQAVHQPQAVDLWREELRRLPCAAALNWPGMRRWTSAACIAMATAWGHASSQPSLSCKLRRS